MQLRSLSLPLAALALLASTSSAQYWSDEFTDPAKFGLGFNDNAVNWAVYDDGGGDRLYVAGGFTEAGQTSAQGLVRWTGSGWEEVGPLNGSAAILTVADIGSGPELFVAGGFTDVAGLPVNGLAAWNGTTWHDVGGGVTGGIFGLTPHDDGTGTALYATGDFTIAGGTVGVQNVARWDGVNWSDVGGGITGPFGGCCTYGAISWDDGTGPGLYIGADPGPTGTGGFAQGVTKWNGTSYEPLGSGLTDGPFNFANAFRVWDDGNGEALFIGGDFAVAGGVTSNHIARWNGTFFENLGGGLTGTTFPYGGQDVFPHDSGDGEELWVSGLFTEAGGVHSPYAARWDGQNWLGARGGISGSSFTTGGQFASFDDGSGSSLWFSGGFEAAGAHESFYVARWQAEPPALTADTATISLAAGGTQRMELRAGAGQALAPFIVIGSITGTFPNGIPVGAVTLPLLGDFYSLATAAGNAPIINGSGVLDASGETVSLFSVPAGFDPNLMGITAYHAFVSLGGGLPSFASNAIQLELQP